MSDTQQGSTEPAPYSEFLDKPYDPNDELKKGASDDLLDLLDQVDLDITGWKPSPGDKIAGTVVDITEGTSDYGDYPLLVIQTPNGNLTAVHCFHQVLRNEVTRKIDSGRLALGYSIAIAYKGEGAASGGNNAPNMYRVAIKPPKE